MGRWQGYLGLMIVCGWAASAGAMDVTRPAGVEYVVKDGNQRPLAGVKITLTPTGGAAAVMLTDEQGRAAVQRKSPAGAVAWREHLRIEKEGYLAVDAEQSLFCGAQKVEETAMQMPRTTVIRVRGPKGEPAAGVPLAFWNYIRPEDPWIRTDARGDYQWVHAPEELFELSLGGTEGRTIRSADVDVLTVSLSADEMQRLATPRKLEGKLLLSNGAAAKGWLVGTEVLRDSSGGIVTGIAIPVDNFVVRRWQKVGEDGVFSTDSPGNFLVAVSPEGMPLVYALNPGSWEQGVRRVTLTLPAVKERMTGELADEAGKPVAGMAVYPNNMVEAGHWWRVSDGKASQSGAVNHGLPDGPAPAKAATDERGRYDVPLYGQMRINSWIAGPTSGFYVTPPIGKASRGTVKAYRTESPEATNPAALKDVTLVFVDEEGKRIKGPWVEKMTASPGEEGRQYGQSPYQDRKGAHYFLNSAVTRMSIQTKDELWKATSREFALGPGDQTIEFRLGDDLRYKPIRGVLLDSAGKPVAGGSVSAYDENVPANNATGGRRYFGGATTDAQGRFEIDGAPDNCKIAAHAADPVTGLSRIAWVDPVEVTAERREMVLREPPNGDVQVLLPAVPGLGKHYEILRAEKISPSGIMVWNMHLDTAAHTLTAKHIPAGTFHLDVTGVPELAPFDNPVVAVEAGKTTVVDWRGKALSAATAAPRWMTVTAIAEGTPLSGAEVAVFREEGTSRLQAAGLDLADGEGRVRVQIRAGEKYVAAARVRGKYSGLAVFSGNADRVTVELRAGEPSAAEGGTELENEALKRVQGEDGTWGSSWGP